MKNVGNDASKFFDTLANNGKSNGGVKLYVPKLKRLSDGKLGYDTEAGHQLAKRVVMGGKTLYSTSWNKNIDMYWMTPSELVSRCSIGANTAEDMSNLIASFTGKTAMDDLTLTTSSSWADGVESQGEFYVMLRVVESYLYNDSNTYRTIHDNISVRVSGISANTASVQGLFFGHQQLLHLACQYSQGRDNFSYNQWLDEVFNDWEGFHNFLAEEAGGMSGMYDKNETIGISAYDWTQDTTKTNEWYYNGDSGSGLGWCYLLKITLPKNVNDELLDFKLQFILSDKGDSVSANGQPTSTASFKILKDSRTSEVENLINSFNDNVSGMVFDSNSQPCVVANDSFDDIIKLVKSADNWSASNVANSVNYDIYVEGYEKNGSTLNGHYTGDSQTAVEGFSLSNDLLLTTAGTITVAGNTMWGSTSIPASEGSLNNITFIPAVVSVRFSFKNQGDEIGWKSVDIYREISDLNASLGVTKTYTEVASDMGGLTNIPSETYTYSVNATPSSATVVIDGVTGSSLVSTKESVSYSVSKTGYVTQSGTLTKDSRTVNVTLVQDASYYTIGFMHQDGRSSNAITLRNLSVNDSPVVFNETLSYTDAVAVSGSFPRGDGNLRIYCDIEYNNEGDTAWSGVLAVQYSNGSATIGTDTIVIEESLDTTLTIPDNTTNVAFILTDEDVPVEEPTKYTYSVIPTPIDATVVIDGVTGITLESTKESVDYRVFKLGYDIVTGTLTKESPSAVVTLNESVETYLYKVTPTPSDATVIIDGQTGKQLSSTKTSVTYEVSKSGYETVTGTLYSSNPTTSITLNPEVVEEPYVRWGVADNEGNATLGSSEVEVENQLYFEPVFFKFETNQTNVGVASVSENAKIYAAVIENDMLQMTDTEISEVATGVTYIAVLATEDAIDDSIDFMYGATGAGGTGYFASIGFIDGEAVADEWAVNTEYIGCTAEDFIVSPPDIVANGDTISIVADNNNIDLIRLSIDVTYADDDTPFENVVDEGNGCYGIGPVDGNINITIDCS